MRMIRAFLPDLLASTREAEIGGPEAHHLLHVLRLKPGDEVQLFDGVGNEFDSIVESVSKKSLRVMIQESRHVSREATRELVVVSAVPKSDRQQFLVEKLVELGVRAWIPVEFENSALGVEEKSLDKWRRYVVEACKQCRRNELMSIVGCARKISPWEVLDSDAVREVLKSNAGSADSEGLRWCLDPRGSEPRSGMPISQASTHAIAIGPEGGFSETELACAREKGWQLVSWGERILRLETAAIAIAANLLAP